MAVLCTDDASCPFAGLLEADDGTRTHDLLHGMCERPCAPVRCRSLKRAPCRASRPRERTQANPSERRTLPFLPRNSDTKLGCRASQLLPTRESGCAAPEGAAPEPARTEVHRQIALPWVPVAFPGGRGVRPRPFADPWKCREIVFVHPSAPDDVDAQVRWSTVRARGAGYGNSKSIAAVPGIVNVTCLPTSEGFPTTTSRCWASYCH
jgi:hypothetical protein